MIHGGAGVDAARRHGDADHDEAGRAGPRRRARCRARRSSRNGGSALDAVEAAARVLEEDPCFNAGRGSVLAYDGHVELDAAIMDGAQPPRRRGRRPAHDPGADQRSRGR